MSLDLAPLTELEAVNEILGSIGDSPVNSLSVTGLVNASLARQALHSMSRHVQSTGWEFNSDKEIQLERDNSGYINLGSNVLRVRASYRDAYRSVTQRGLKLYDKTNRTFVFEDDIYVDRVLFLEWDALPSAARDYITIAAARKFQRGFIGSMELNEITQEDEIKALAALKDAEGENLQATFLEIGPFNAIISRTVI